MSEVVRNSLKERLARGEVASSMTVRLSRSVEIAQVAATAGFDSLYIDLEHSSLSLETTSQICCAALTCGIAPLVRVAQVELIQRVLDGGALGVIAPDVRSADQAREIVRATKYPPQGERGFASVIAQLQYRTVPTRELYRAVNDATMVIVQFESAEAIDRADEIFAVEGVDMALFGTNDLTADMGIPGDYEIRACATPMRVPSRRRRSTASMSASAGLALARSSPPSSSRWARAMFRPAPISVFCSAPRPSRQGR